MVLGLNGNSVAIYWSVSASISKCTDLYGKPRTEWHYQSHMCTVYPFSTN